MKKETRYSNKKFAQENRDFQEACEKMNVAPTSRQASKFRNSKGIAYKGK